MSCCYFLACFSPTHLSQNRCAKCSFVGALAIKMLNLKKEKKLLCQIPTAKNSFTQSIKKQTNGRSGWIKIHFLFFLIFLRFLTVTCPSAAPWRRSAWTGTSLCHQRPGRWRWDGTLCLALDSWQAVKNLWWSAQSHQVNCPSAACPKHNISGCNQHRTQRRWYAPFKVALCSFISLKSLLRFIDL